MRKAFRFILVLCVIGLMSAAFQPTRADGLPEIVKMPDQIAGGRPVTFTITNMPPETDTAARPAWDAMVKRFQDKYPNVTVQGLEYTYQPDSFAALVAGQQVPTIFQVYMTDPQKYISTGVAADISSIIDANKLRDVFNTDILNLATNDGKVYGIPYNAYAMGIGYNIDLLKAAGFDKPPATWDELRTMAVKLTNRDAGVVGFSMINDGGPATGWHFTVLAYTFGAKPEEIIKAGADGKYTAGLDSEAMVNAMQLVKDLRWTDDVMPRDTLDWGTNGTQLATGKAAIVLMAGDQYRWIKTSFRETDMNAIGFAPLPAGPGGVVSLTGGDMYMVSAAATDDEKEAAVYFELWRLFDPAEVQLGLEAQGAEENPAVGGPALPLFKGEYQAAKETFQKPFYTLPYDNYSAFLDAFASGKAHLQVEPTPAGQEYYAAIGAVVSTIITDQNADPAALLKDASATFQSTQLDQIGSK
ncbi:MAG: extracellular solute-binding protein [Anaerolineae bacterium]|nr:extracellular solute-binding protein [Anaerolineae bacterium]